MFYGKAVNMEAITHTLLGPLMGAGVGTYVGWGWLGGGVDHRLTTAKHGLTPYCRGP